MKKRKPTGKGRRRSFQPDLFVTALGQAITRDLEDAKQEYGIVHSEIVESISVQISDLSKKYEWSTTDIDGLTSEAYSKFEHVNDYIGRINSSITFPRGKRLVRSLPFMDKVHIRAKALVSEVLGDLWEDDWFLATKHSKGSSLGVPYADTSLERKSSYPLSATRRAIPVFDRYLAWDFQYQDALEKFNAGRNPRYQLVQGARATTVPKDSKKRRFISVEPTCNMYMQQGLMHLMYKRLRVQGLDVASLPERHKRLAREASIVGNYATIDFSSASDSVGIELLKWLLPVKWFDALDMVRSPCTFIEGKQVDLNMFSTMGNAGTFPLETLVFWAYACATFYTISRPRCNSMFIEQGSIYRRAISVFGDDCIVPSEIAVEFMTVMEGVGFDVNSEKSFFGAERFRESCGGDYLSGFPMRPYCIKVPSSVRNSSIEAWLYTVFNRLQQKYILYFGRLTYLYNRHAFHLIFRTLRDINCKIKLVPPYSPDDAGIHGIDCDRVIACYGRYGFSPIAKDKHGTCSFLYKRFQYKTKAKRDDHLRYVRWLKSPTLSYTHIRDRLLRDEVDFYAVRRIGGYVVGRGFSSHWEGPTVRSH